MAKIEARTNEICNLIQQKNKLGFGISSPQAKKLEDAVKGLEEELSQRTSSRRIGQLNTALVKVTLPL